MTNAFGRRQLINAAALGTIAAIMPRSALPATWAPTPRQTAGPFYPETLPLDMDNDLVRVAGRPDPAVGTVTHVMGQVLDLDGRPVSGARVEVWQCDAGGRYLHPADPGHGKRDAGFQGYGQTRTDAGGAYRFRTIKPVPYTGRTPHIHFAISSPGFERLTTQMYVAGEPRNDSDFVLSRIDPAARGRVIVALEPAPDIEDGALKGRFDIVLGA